MAKNVRHAIERSLRALLRQAGAAADDDTRSVAKRVHDLRTELKKANALLRLVEPLLGGRGRQERRKLAAMARRVGSVRDAAAVVETFDRLTRGRRGRSSASAKLRGRLAAWRRKREGSRRTARDLRRAVKALRRVRHRVKGLLDRGDGRRAMAMGFTNGYRRACVSMKTAGRLHTPVAFHAWRRTVKTHSFHVQILVGVGVAGLGVRARPLKTLGETLGAAQDLTLLEASLLAECWLAGTPGAHDALLALVKERRHELEAEALAMGRRLFQKRSGAMRRTIAASSNLLRFQEEPDTGAISWARPRGR